MPRTGKSIDKYIKGYIGLGYGRMEGLGVMAKAVGFLWDSGKCSKIDYGDGCITP